MNGAFDQPPPPATWLSLRRWLLRSAIVLIVILIAAEFFTRYYLGLGDPPLMMADADIEYLFQPSRSYQRFGNLVHYNAYSMRSGEFAAIKTDPNEVRILMVGDSVINGGGLTDQSDLASSRLERRLADDLSQPVMVGNISAGSWGPPNQLAYLQKYGLFDADLFVLVLSSHDAQDAPTFAPIVGVDPSFPDRPPTFALEEAITRYLPRYVPWPVAAPGTALPSSVDHRAQEVAMHALRSMIELIRDRGIPVLILLHPEQGELSGPRLDGYDAIRNLAHESDVEIIDFQPALQSAQGAGHEPYRDNIHLSSEGQRVMTDVLFEPIKRAITKGLSTMPDRPSSREKYRHGR